MTKCVCVRGSCVLPFLEQIDEEQHEGPDHNAKYDANQHRHHDACGYQRGGVYGACVGKHGSTLIHVYGHADMLRQLSGLVGTLH